MKKILYLLLSHSPLPILVSCLVEIRRPQFLVQAFIKKYFIEKLKVDISEAELPVEKYQNVLEFFTRRLKAGVRPVVRGSRGARQVVSPVDGAVMSYGKIVDGEIVQIKNITYSLEKLVGSDIAEKFYGGDYITIYLSPRDYHRIHHPVEGQINKVVGYHGRILPVNRFSLENFREVFSRNRRLVFCYNSQDNSQGKRSSRKKFSQRNQNYHQPVLLPCLNCWVGALNVGKMRLSFDENFYQQAETETHDFRERLTRSYPNLNINKGDEAGCFELGSTVILIFPPHSIRWMPTVSNNTFFRVGEPIAHIHSKAV